MEINLPKGSTEFSSLVSVLPVGLEPLESLVQGVLDTLLL